MQVLSVAGERGVYQVVVSRGAVVRLGELLDDRAIARPRAAVTNSTVAPLHGRRAAEAAGAPAPFELADGESHKRWPSVEAVIDRWLDDGLHRGQSVLAVGGGVVTDTVGFAAAVYLRGVDWIAVPTTVLAMVDAAVGGKTGINLERGKNLVGAFWAPRLVVADPDTLATLPAREVRAGLVEVVKAIWISDHGLLELLPGPVDGFAAISPETWETLIARSVQVKAVLVESDERESGPRKALNLGHTVGHALEAATGYRTFLHGEAVAWGLAAAAGIARRRGLLSAVGLRRLTAALERLGPYPPIRSISAARLLEHLVRDKKRDDLGIGWVLPTDDGVVLDQRVTADEVREVFEELKVKG
jgi:3-dehydroquinate synthase